MKLNRYLTPKRRYKRPEGARADEIERQTRHDTEVSMVSSLIDSEHTPSRGASQQRRRLGVAAASLLLAGLAALVRSRRKKG